MSRKLAIVIGALLLAIAIYTYLRQPAGEVAAPDDVASEAVATPVDSVATPVESVEAPAAQAQPDNSIPTGSLLPEPATQPGLVADDVEETAGEDPRGRPEQVVSVRLPILTAPPAPGEAPEAPSDTTADEVRAIAEATASIDNTGPQQQFPGPGEEALSRVGEDAIQIPGENLLVPGAAPEAFDPGASYAAPEANSVVTDTSAPESDDQN